MFAWKADAVWSLDAMPLWVEWSGVPEGLTHDDTEDAIRAARAAWVEHSCSAFDLSIVEVGTAETDGDDGVVSIVFGDPNDVVADGVRSVRFANGTGNEVRRSGVAYTELGDVDFVYNDGVEWATDAEIAGGDCTSAESLQGYLTHAFGALAGLGNPCSDADCTAEEQDALMGRPERSCSLTWSEIGADDAQGMAALYGTEIGFSCRPDPENLLAAYCVLDSPTAGFSSATWDFGDGATAQGTPATHVYDAAGGYTISLCVALDACVEPMCSSAAFTARVGAGEQDTGGVPTAAGCECASAGRGVPATFAGIVLAGALSWHRRRVSPLRGWLPNLCARAFGVL